MARKRNKKSLTEIQRQIRRIKQGVYRANKKGYAISFNDLVNEDTSLSTLKNITPAYIRQRAEYKVNTETGELEFENSNFYTVDMQSDFIIQQFRDNVSKYFPGKNDISNPSEYINSWLDELIHNEGKNKVADMLTTAKAQGLWVTPEEFYKMGSTYSYIYLLDSLFDEIEANNFNGEIWIDEYD